MPVGQGDALLVRAPVPLRSRAPPPFASADGREDARAPAAASLAGVALVSALCSAALARPAATRQSLNRRAVLAAAAAATLPSARVLAEDKVVPKAKVGVTPGGVKYFDKEGGSCSPFNPTTTPRYWVSPDESP